MNKILAGKFPESENEVMVDENDACKFGKTFLDSVQKKIVINDKIYTISGVVSKEDEQISEKTHTFVFMMNNYDNIETCSVIVHSKFPNIFILQKYIEFKYKTKNLIANSQFLKEIGRNSFGLPTSIENILYLSNFLSALILIIVQLLKSKCNKKISNIFQFMSVAVVSISICLTSSNIKNVRKLISDSSNYSYKLVVNDDQYGYKENISTYLDRELKKYNLSFLDIRYEYVNVSLKKQHLSENYIKYLKNLSTNSAIQLSPYSQKITIPIVMIYTDQNTMQSIVYNYDGTVLNENECIAIKNIYSNSTLEHKFLIEENETVQINFVTHSGELSTQELIIKKSFENFTLMSNDINLPVLFVSRDCYEDYVNNMNVNGSKKRVIYFNADITMAKTINDEFSNLCGFSFLDLAAQKQHYNKIEESLICQTLMLVVVLCLFLLSLFLSTTYTNNVKNKIRKLVIVDAITATVYFLANIIINYLLYNYSIKINIFYEYAVPIIEILVTSLCLISFLNIKILRH